MCGDSTTCVRTALGSPTCHVTPAAAAAWLDLVWTQHCLSWRTPRNNSSGTADTATPELELL